MGHTQEPGLAQPRVSRAAWVEWQTGTTPWRWRAVGFYELEVCGRSIGELRAREQQAERDCAARHDALFRGKSPHVGGLSSPSVNPDGSACSVLLWNGDDGGDDERPSWPASPNPESPVDVCLARS